jgi:integrase
VSLNTEDYGTHSLRQTKASILHKQTGNRRVVQILLGHTRIESTVRHLGVDVEDALALSEGRPSQSELLAVKSILPGPAFRRAEPGAR